MRDFRKYEVWKMSMDLVKDVYGLVKNFPKEERFSLTNQVTRSAISIPSNIAEGCSRATEADFKRFLEIALGSSFELETQLQIAVNIEYISFDLELHQVAVEKLNRVQKMLNALIVKARGK